MAVPSLSSVVAQALLAAPDRVASWTKAWRVATESGSTESLIDFVCRESGTTEEAFLQQLARVLDWPFVDLRKNQAPVEARNKISTKVAFQYCALPTDFQDGILQVTVCNPFDLSMISAVEYDAHAPVEFALASKIEIEKALKKYYGVGAETLDELQKLARGYGWDRPGGAPKPPPRQPRPPTTGRPERVRVPSSTTLPAVRR